MEAEEAILSGTPQEPIDLEGLLQGLARRYPQVDLTRLAERVDLAAGEVLLRAGDTSVHVCRLVRGKLRAELRGVTGARIVVARFQPGALIGEMAYYGGYPRSADVVAETDSTVLRYDLAALDADPKAAEFVRDFHREAARILSQRLLHMTRLVRDADL